MKWLRYLTSIPQLLALLRGILELVRTAEDFLAGGGRGEQKKALVVNLLDTALKLGDKLGVLEVRELERARVLEVAGTVVDTVVSTLNALGVFKHTPRPGG